MAGAGHAQGQNPGAAEKPAAEAAFALRAAAGVGDPARRIAGPAARARRADRDVVEAGSRCHQPGCQARRLQARHGAAAPVHESARARRAWPPARHGAQSRRAEGRTGGAGARRVPGAGGDEGPRTRGSFTFSLLSRGRAGCGRRLGGGKRLSHPASEGGRSGRTLHVLELRRAARADGNPQGRHQPGRLPGADRPGRCRHDRGVRRAGRGCGPAPGRPAPPVRAAVARRFEIPREEHPGPAEDGRGAYGAGHAGGVARPDHRGRARACIPAGAAADRRGIVQAPHRRGPRAADVDRQRSGAAGRHHPYRVRGCGAQDQGHAEPA